MTTIQIEKPRILILNCNRFELATLADSLRMQSLDVVGQASDISAALELFSAVNPQSILVSFQGCDQRCIDLLISLRELNPQLGIVLLTDTSDLRLYGFRQESLPIGTQIIEKSALNDLREIRSAIDISNQPGVRTGWLANDWNSSTKK